MTVLDVNHELEVERERERKEEEGRGGLQHPSVIVLMLVLSMI